MLLFRKSRRSRPSCFCRQLLSHTALLPAALRAHSIEEFLADEAIADSDLRDLCLKVEQPSLEALRDACADLLRGDEPDEEVEDVEDREVEQRSAFELFRHHLRYGHLESLLPERSLFYDMLSPRSRKSFPTTRNMPRSWNRRVL